MPFTASLPGMADNRRTIRAVTNPQDKCTIVSIYPRRIDEVKHTIQPGRFIIEPGTYDNPSFLEVGTSSWWMERDPSQPFMEIPVSSIAVANSVVIDYCNGLLGYKPNISMPGLFYVPGELDVFKIRDEYQVLIDKARDVQNKWYEELVEMADHLWAVSKGDPRSIGDNMRLAAQELQFKDKSWLKDFATRQLTNCPACGTLRNTEYPVCQNCKTVTDKTKFEQLGLQFAS